MIASSSSFPACRSLASRLDSSSKNPVLAAAGLRNRFNRVISCRWSRFPKNNSMMIHCAADSFAGGNDGGDHELIRGCSSATIRSPLRKAWEVAADFFSLHKWVPSVQECYEIERNVRFCKSFPSESSRASTWVKEELLMIDSDKHILRYQIIDGNMGLEDYTATMKFSAVDEDDGSCFLEWSFTMSPRSPKSKEEQEKYLAYGIKSLEKRAQSIL